MLTDHRSTFVVRRHSARRAQRLFSILVVISFAFAIFADSALANVVYQDAYYLAQGTCCNGYQIDGLRATIRADTLAPRSDNCVLFSVLVYQPKVTTTTENYSEIQVESGLVRCGSSTTIDGTCSQANNYVRFTEVFQFGEYVCYSHGEFTPGGTGIAFAVRRDEPGSDNWYAYIGGNNMTEGAGPIDSSSRNVLAWGEATGADAATCGTAWKAYGAFTNFQWYNRNLGYTTIKSPSSLPKDCFTKTAVSSGAFQIYKGV